MENPVTWGQVAEALRKGAQMADAAAARSRPGLTAGHPNVERVFYYVAAALRAGADPRAVAALYDGYAEQLDQHPRAAAQQVCRELAAMAEAADRVPARQ